MSDHHQDWTTSTMCDLLVKKLQLFMFAVYSSEGLKEEF